MNRRSIGNKFGSDPTYPTANNDDHFSSNVIDDIVEKQTDTPPSSPSTQLNIHFMWILLKDLLTSLVSTNGDKDNQNTEKNFELNTNDSEYDYLELDDSNYLTIIDGDLKDDEYFQKHKLLKQKLLGNFQLIYKQTKFNQSNKSMPSHKNKMPILSHKTAHQIKTHLLHLYPHTELKVGK